MQTHFHNYRHWVNLLLVVVLMSLFSLPLVTNAQDATSTSTIGTPVEIAGVVTQTMGSSVIIAGITVDVSHITLDPNLVVGSTVRVRGLALNNIIVAQTVVIVNIISPTSTPTPVPGTATATPLPGATFTPIPTLTPTALGGTNVIVVVEGPVINIVNNIVTIYNFNIQVAPENPILSIIDIGDVVHVEGDFDDHGVILAHTISNVSSTTIVSNGPATVSLDGPVESVNGTQIVVNNVPARLAPDDPRLNTIKVGDFVRLQGNFQGSGANVVIVIVNITIINNVIVNGSPTCWFHDDGMGMGMGHWHCDGMGMGDPGMGMGDDGMGMGMGDPAMGMGG